MDILITNINLQKEDRHIIITPNGEVLDTDYRGISMPTESQAIALPEHHGTLKDVDEIKKKQKHSYHDFCENVVSVYDIDNSPVIVEASK